MRLGTNARLSATLLSMLPALAAFGQATFTPIYNPAPVGAAFCTGVSADGMTVVGHALGNYEGWIWSEAGGFVNIGGSLCYGVSGDGKWVVGNTSYLGGPINHPGIWSEDTGWISLGQLPGAQSCDNSYGSGWDISRDARAVSGLGWANICDGVPFRWSEATGMVQAPMQDPLLHYAARASTISGNGRVLGGWEANTFGTWRPVIWLEDATQVFLAPDPENTPGEVFDLNFDGSIAVGQCSQQAYYWTADEGMVQLPPVPGTSGLHMALGVSDDGRVIAGRNDSSFTAVIWLDGQGHNLKQFLIDHGATGLEGFALFNAIGVSADGTVITGSANAPGWPVPVAFRATIPPLASAACPWDCEPAGGDGEINVLDLLGVLANWGTCGNPGDCPWDCEPAGGDGVVNVLDLLGVLGAWGPCASVPPSGACCTFDGDCFEGPELACNIINGTWHEGEDCISMDCLPVPTGACCTPAQDCTDLTEADCPWVGGTWYEGEQCATFICPPPAVGACCLWPLTDCVMIAEFECADAGGIFYGVGSDCAGVTCPVPAQGDTVVDPFIIPALPFSGDGDTTGFTHDYWEPCGWSGLVVAADVVYAYTPTETVTVDMAMCAGTDPTYQARLYVYEDAVGNLVDCARDGCEYPYSPLLLGVTLQVGHTYYIIIDGDYNLEEGYYTLDVYENSVGACCLLDGSCQDVTLTDCNFLGGEWFAGETCATFTCPPQPLGACCFWPGGECDDLTQFNCEQAGGDWHGAGTGCATIECPVPGGPGDTIATAYVVPALPFSDVGDSTFYVNDYDAACPFPSTAPDVVYAFTPTSNMTVTVSLCAASEYDTKLFIYENVAGNLVDCNDNACQSPAYPNGPFVSELAAVELTAGNTYYIIVDGYGPWSGVYTLDIF